MAPPPPPPCLSSAHTRCSFTMLCPSSSPRGHAVFEWVCVLTGDSDRSDAPHSDTHPSTHNSDTHPSTPLRRLSAGVVYLAHILFDSVTLFSPRSDCPVFSRQFLVCRHFDPVPNGPSFRHVISRLPPQIPLVLEHLFAVYGATLVQPSGTSLLEIVNIKSLFEHKFYRFIRQRNDQLIAVSTLFAVSFSDNFGRGKLLH